MLPGHHSSLRVGNPADVSMVLHASVSSLCHVRLQQYISLSVIRDVMTGVAVEDNMELS
jgi:hypothetical protein